MPVWLIPVFLFIGFLLGRISRGSNESGVRKIEAIKIYRAFHHVDLKDAKDIVDAMERSLVLPPS